MESSGTISSVSTSITTTTTYVAGFVYQSVQYGATSLASSQYTNKLQFFGQDEGRVRALYGNTSSPNTLTGFVFDYYIRDHLGNTRMTLTEEQETDVYPTLTFEGAGSADVASQDATWDNSSGTAIGVMSVRQTPLPTGLTSGANGTYYASVVKGDQGGAIGAAKLIKVMARDQLNVSVNYNYNSATVDNSGANGLRTLVSSLAGMILGSSQVSAAVQSEASMVATNTGTSSAVTGFFSPEVPSSVTTGVAPEAYLHVLLFNDQFVFDNVNSMVMPISTAGLNASATLTVIATAAKNGYAYIYFSNESNTPVNFDNLALTDTRGPILETTDYYPFGLMMAGVSDVALKGGYSENKYRYNGKELQSQEFSDGSGLEEYDYGARLQDPQLGVWHNMDPLADKNRNWSPYNYAFDSPNGFVDPDGADAEQVGPDGLTNEQWAEASRPNANPTLASAYNAENLQQEFLQNRFQAAEKKFYETWDAATKETDPQKRTDGYIKAFLDIYDEFSDFASEAPKSEFFFKFGGKRGDATEFAQTDPEPVSPASSEAVEQPSHKNKVQIQVFDESIQEISNRTHTFGFIVRAFFHETVHVRQAQHHYDVYANQTSVYELDAYYISSTNQYLPPMSNGESIGNAGNAIRNFFIHMQDDTREAAYKLYQKKIDYFMGFFTKEAKDRIHEALKF